VLQSQRYGNEDSSTGETANLDWLRGTLSFFPGLRKYSPANRNFANKTDLPRITETIGDAIALAVVLIRRKSGNAGAATRTGKKIKGSEHPVRREQVHW